MSSISGQLASQFTALQQAEIAQQAATSVLKKTQEISETQGQAVLALLDSAAQVSQNAPSIDPNIGTQIDVNA